MLKAVSAGNRHFPVNALNHTLLLSLDAWHDSIQRLPIWRIHAPLHTVDSAHWILIAEFYSHLLPENPLSSK